MSIIFPFSTSSNYSLPSLGTTIPPGVVGDRIVNGKEVPWEDHEWVVYLNICTPPGSSTCAICGGTILSSTTILTAAHCVKDDSESLQTCDGTATYGTADNKDQEHQVTFTCSGDAVLHPQLDVAIIVLQGQEFEEGQFEIFEIPSDESLNPEKGDVVTVPGWGDACEDEACDDQDYLPRMLQAVKITVEDDVCGIEFEGKEFCAGGLNNGVPQDACSGDSGGPVECSISSSDDSTETYLCGVVSRGPAPPDCGKSPGTYIRIAENDMIDWLVENGAATKTKYSSDRASDYGSKNMAHISVDDWRVVSSFIIWMELRT